MRAREYPFWLHPRYNIDYHDSAVLKEILSGEATEVVVEKIHELLTKLGEAVRNNDIPIDDYIIFKVSSIMEIQPSYIADHHLLKSVLVKTRKITQTRNLNPMFKSPFVWNKKVPLFELTTLFHISSVWMNMERAEGRRLRIGLSILMIWEDKGQN